VDPILRDLGRFLHALRGIDLDDRDREVLRELSTRSDLVTVEVLCSLFEKVREYGFLQGIQGHAPETERSRHVEPQPWGEADRGPGA
jgi:hypothetical protein